jgi:hypothetical protein
MAAQMSIDLLGYANGVLAAAVQLCLCASRVLLCAAYGPNVCVDASQRIADEVSAMSAVL